MGFLTAFFGLFIAALSAWLTASVKNAFEERKLRTEWRKELLQKYASDEENFQKFSQQFANGIIFLDDKINSIEVHQKYFIPSNFSFTIGRSPECDVVLNDNTVSRLHALVTATKGGLFWEDLAPTNPTIVNGKVIEGRIKVEGSITAILGNVELTVVRLASDYDNLSWFEKQLHDLLT